MANVPPDLFRRKKTFQALKDIETITQQYKDAAALDHYGAVMAGYNDLAAHFASLAGRHDIAKEFDRQRDQLIADVQTAPPLRSPRGERKEYPSDYHTPRWRRGLEEADKAETVPPDRPPRPPRKKKPDPPK